MENLPEKAKFMVNEAGILAPGIFSRLATAFREG